MKYIDAFKCISADYQRYEELYSGGGKLIKLLKIWIHERGFVYSFWLRLVKVRSPLRPIIWLIYHHLSSKYGMQISSQTTIGPGLYIGHGVGVIINSSSKIGSNVTLSQFLSIGSNKGKAATIEDNVYIAPSVCLVEDIIIGHNSVIGAGSVVTKNVPPYSMVAGVPAKIIKKFNLSTKKWEKCSI